MEQNAPELRGWLEGGEMLYDVCGVSHYAMAVPPTTRIIFFFLETKLTQTEVATSS